MKEGTRTVASTGGFRSSYSCGAAGEFPPRHSPHHFGFSSAGPLLDYRSRPGREILESKIGNRKSKIGGWWWGTGDPFPSIPSAVGNVYFVGLLKSCCYFDFFKRKSTGIFTQLAVGASP
jgi:hypothetical protein